MAMQHYHAQTYVENGENNQGQHAVSQTYGYQDGHSQPTRTYTESTAVYHAPQSTTTHVVHQQQPTTTTTTYQGSTNTSYAAANRSPGYTVSTTNYDQGRTTYSQTQPTSTTVYTPGQTHTTTTYGGQPGSYQPRTSNQGLSHGALQGGVQQHSISYQPSSPARETVKLVENTPEYKVYQYRSVHKETLKIDDASRKVVHGDRFSDGTPVKRTSYAGSEMSPEGHFNPRRSTPYSNSKYITVVRNGREIKEEIFDYN